MKDYYAILDVAENASQDDIKSSFRQLAFKYHPDVNPGHEKQAEEKFKEINEAYSVLGDPLKRQQYDQARRLGYAYQGSQADIFRDAFTNQANIADLNRMFGQAGLRFDQEFLNRVFFQGQGIVFTFSAGPGGTGQTAYRFNNNQTQPTATPGQTAPVPKPNLIDRLLIKAIMGLTRFSVRVLFGVRLPPLKDSLDTQQELKLAPSEALAGTEKKVVIKRGLRRTRLLVKVPPGIKSGALIRLAGMGKRDHHHSGDLYLHVNIRQAKR